MPVSNVEKKPKSDLEDWKKYFLIVPVIGLVGLVVSILLLTEFSEPLMNIFKKMLGAVFG